MKAPIRKQESSIRLTPAFVILMALIVIVSICWFSGIVPKLLQPRPTPTLLPTSTPRPTPTPHVVTCDEIRLAHEDVTVLQWKEYVDSTIGLRIYFSGTIRNVDLDYTAGINSDDLCRIELSNIPHSVAIELSKGQQVEGYGVIREMDDAWWGINLTIDVGRGSVIPQLSPTP